MIGKSQRIWLLAAVAIVVGMQQARCGDSLSVIRRDYLFTNPNAESFSLSLGNPALAAERHVVSLSNAGIEARLHHESEAVDERLDRGEAYWRAGAESYLRRDGTTLWGHARYRRGRIKEVRLNESADTELVYPYTTADSIGGDLTEEIYSLCGGYSGGKGGWRWGAELSYDAGIYFREVDPRPKNTTGLLDIKAGAALKIGRGYSLGASVDARKYKQTCDIMFVSESGSTEIYHPTGLGNVYNRFTGASSTSHYSGWRTGVAGTLFPAKAEGFVATLELSRFNLKKILVDLNKLPLCRIRHDEFRGEIGYMWADWAASLTMSSYRRLGFENIFGDAAAGVYPLIGELGMYADDLLEFAAKGMSSIRFAPYTRLDLTAAAGFNHRREQYAFPAKEHTVDSFIAEMDVRFRKVFSDRWSMTASSDVAHVTDCHTRVSAGIRIDRTINSSYAISVATTYTYARYQESKHSDTWNLSAKIIF